MRKEEKARKGGPTFPRNLSLFLYPETDGGGFVAQCLELDLIGMDMSVEGALQQLLELIDVQFESCKRTGASFRFRSSKADWAKYNLAKSGGKKVPLELMERIVGNVDLDNYNIKFRGFVLLKSKLSALGINWDKRKGKGSHGAFTGYDRSGNRHSFTIPHAQQKEVKKQMLNKLRERFQLDESDLDEYFASKK